jgi:phospholipid-binding lipoprotein MlaA
MITRVTLLLLVLLASTSQLTACATAPDSEKPVRSEADPWEPMNRVIYSGNQFFDKIILKPIAKGYDFILPSPVRRSIMNFSVNLFTPRSSVSNFLQGKPDRGLDDIGRFLINSTIGILGLFDVASASGIPRYNENFSQTMAVWGVPEGPYLIIPLLGPQSVLDAVMIPADIQFDPLFHYDNSSVRDRLYALRVIDLRSRLLVADKILDESEDSYITLREMYLQNRQFKIYDGDPPEDEELLDDFFDDE